MENTWPQQALEAGFELVDGDHDAPAVCHVGRRRGWSVTDEGEVVCDGWPGLGLIVSELAGLMSRNRGFRFWRQGKAAVSHVRMRNTVHRDDWCAGGLVVELDDLT